MTLNLITPHTNEAEETENLLERPVPTIQLNGEYGSGKSTEIQHWIDRVQDQGFHVGYVGAETAGITKDGAKVGADLEILNDNACPDCNPAGDFETSLLEHEESLNGIDLLLSEGTGNPVPAEAARTIESSGLTSLQYNLLMINGNDGERAVDTLSSQDLNSLNLVCFNRPSDEFNPDSLENYLDNNGHQDIPVLERHDERMEPEFGSDATPILRYEDGSEIDNWSAKQLDPTTGKVAHTGLLGISENSGHTHKDQYQSTISPEIGEEDVLDVLENVPEEDLEGLRIQVNHRDYGIDIVDGDSGLTESSLSKEKAPGYFIVQKIAGQSIPDNVKNAFEDLQTVSSSSFSMGDHYEKALNKIEMRGSKIDPEREETITYRDAAEMSERPIALPENYKLAHGTAAEAAMLWEDIDEVAEKAAEVLDQTVEAGIGIHEYNQQEYKRPDPVTSIELAEDIYWGSEKAGLYEDTGKEEAAHILAYGMQELEEHHVEDIGSKSDGQEWFEYMEYIMEGAVEHGILDVEDARESVENVNQYMPDQNRLTYKKPARV